MRDAARLVIAGFLGAVIAWLPGTLIHLFGRPVSENDHAVFSLLLAFATCVAWLLVRRERYPERVRVVLPLVILFGIWILAPLATTISRAEGTSQLKELGQFLKMGGGFGWLLCGFSGSTYEGSLLGLCFVTVGLPVVAMLESVMKPARPPGAGSHWTP